MNNNPIISIIIPSYNRANYIAQSIESVLSQSFRDFELIIIDDGSTDNTVEIAKNYLRDPRVKIVQNEKNIGIAKTRNKAVSIAKGKYIAMLDSDDVWLDKDKLTKQIEFLEKNPEYALIGSAITHIDEKGNKLQTKVFPTSDNEIRNIILKTNPIAQSSIVCKREIIINAGMYDEHYTVCEDYDLWLRIGKIAKLANLKEVVVGYRVHDTNTTRKRNVIIAKYLIEIINKYKKDYPNYWQGIIKAYMRLILAYIRP